MSSTQNVCDNGSICPGGFICDTQYDRCLLPEQSAVCKDQPDGMPCTFSGTISGSCLGAACEPFRCGDGVVSAGEECDGTNLNGADCKTFNYYGTDGLACSPSCKFVEDGCKVHEYCGDGVINGPELCDGPEMRTCIAIGFDAGTASCNQNCSFSINDCSRFGWNPESLSNVVALAVAGSSKFDQWAFGDSGRAMHFEGAYWNNVPTGVQNNLIRGWANSKTDAWALGQSRASGPTLDSVVLHWDGTAWAAVTGIPAGEYIDVWGTASNGMYVVTDSGAAIYKFDGTTWTTLPSFAGEPIAIRGTAANDIWVATKGGALQHFDGSAWTDRTPSGAAIQFLDANAADDVWAIGPQSGDQSNAVAAHWNGSGWVQYVFAQSTFNAVASSTSNDAWVAGTDGIMRHWDGVGWSSSTNIGASPSGTAALSGLISFGSSDVVAVSTLNLAYRYKGQTFGTLPALGSNPFDAPDNTAIWTHDTKLSYVTNVKGEVWKYDGAAWTLDYTVTNAPIPVNDVFGTAPEDVWAVDGSGEAHHFNGLTWSGSTVSASIALEKVWTNGTDVWVFGPGGAFQKNGSSWTHYALGSQNVLSVSGTSGSDIWAVESGNKLWHWDGSMWNGVDPMATTDLLAVYALATDNVHVTARSGRMLHWNGSTWTETVIGVLADLTRITATAPDDVIAISERDIAHYDGVQWSTMRPPVDFAPNSSNYLPLVAVAATQGRIDMLQVRYRIRTLVRTRPLVCRERETCGDGVDNDCDGTIDHADTECP